MNSIKGRNDPSPSDNLSWDISTLRVAQSELLGGDTSGKVYMRLSPGSVAFLKDRSEVKQRLSGQIRQAVLDESSKPTTS
jgi:hypothetical protein